MSARHINSPGKYDGRCACDWCKEEWARMCAEMDRSRRVAATAPPIPLTKHGRCGCGECRTGWQAKWAAYFEETAA